MPHCRLGNLLLLAFSAISRVALAVGPPAHLVVNCGPSPFPPAGAVCFDKRQNVPFTFWVLAVDSFYQVVPTYTGTVHITSDDPSATLPPDHTFTAADAGVVPLSISFHSLTTDMLPSPQVITATDSANRLTGSITYYLSPTAVKAVPASGQISALVLACSLTTLGLYSLTRRIKRGPLRTKASNTERAIV